jgi:hypothetical protein
MRKETTEEKLLHLTSYVEYLAEKLDESISYSEYIAGEVDTLDSRLELEEEISRIRLTEDQTAELGRLLTEELFEGK